MRDYASLIASLDLKTKVILRRTRPVRRGPGANRRPHAAALERRSEPVGRARPRGELLIARRLVDVRETLALDRS